MKTKFNKSILWMLAAILICGAVMLTSCSKDNDDDVKKEETQKPDDNGGNSGGEEEVANDLFEKVNGNVDVNNGGGGVNVVR